MANQKRRSPTWSDDDRLVPLHPWHRATVTRDPHKRLATELRRFALGGRDTETYHLLSDPDVETIEAAVGEDVQPGDDWIEPLRTHLIRLGHSPAEVEAMRLPHALDLIRAEVRATSQGRRSPPLSKTELARRIQNKGQPRTRDVDWTRFDLRRAEGVGTHKWTVRTDDMDPAMRERVEGRP